jgi:hypothetical protein
MIGLIEVGNCGSCELKELSAEPTGTGLAVGVLMPATIDEMIEETLESRVADGVAEIWDKSEDICGRMDDGNCEIWEPRDVKAGPRIMFPAVGTLIVTLGEAADNKEEIAEEILGSKVADDPAAET